MKKTKEQKGITLVALIITIVVLFVLAGITIANLDNTNIIEHANNATNTYNDEVGKENILLNELQQQICEHKWNFTYSNYQQGRYCHLTKKFCAKCGLSFSYYEACTDEPGGWCYKCNWEIS